MTDQLKRLQQNYRARFLRYLSRRDELALWSAYELGREGLSGGVSLLDVVQIHHRVLVDVLRDTGGSELQDVAEAATTFLLEVLASFEMTRRGFFAAGARTAAEPPPDHPR
jgi:Phosphoserine phosphatase RsbU, N-terminal domain